MLNIFYSRYPPFLSHLITSYHLWVRQIADWQKPAQSRFVGPRCHFSLTYLQQYPGRSHCKRWQWCIGIWRTCLKNCGELMQVVGCCRDCTSQLTVERCWKTLKVLAETKVQQVLTAEHVLNMVQHLRNSQATLGKGSHPCVLRVPIEPIHVVNDAHHFPDASHQNLALTEQSQTKLEPNTPQTSQNHPQNLQNMHSGVTECTESI